MASSDNVVRGGLTSKRVDSQALAGLLDPDATPLLEVPRVTLSPHEVRWQPPVPDFALSRVVVSNVPVTLSQQPSDPVSPEVLLCLNGEVTVSSDGDDVPCSIQTLHTDALFASALQRSDDLSLGKSGGPSPWPSTGWAPRDAPGGSRRSSATTRRPRPPGCAGPGRRWLHWMVRPFRGSGGWPPLTAQPWPGTRRRGSRLSGRRNPRRRAWRS